MVSDDNGLNMTSSVATTKSKGADGLPFPTDMPDRKPVGGGLQLIDASNITLIGHWPAPLSSMSIG